MCQPGPTGWWPDVVVADPAVGAIVQLHIPAVAAGRVAAQASDGIAIVGDRVGVDEFPASEAPAASDIGPVGSPLVTSRPVLRWAINEARRDSESQVMNDLVGGVHAWSSFIGLRNPCNMDPSLSRILLQPPDGSRTFVMRQTRYFNNSGTALDARRLDPNPSTKSFPPVLCSGSSPVK